MTAAPRPPQAVPQAAAVDSDERDDGPNPVGIMLILCAGMTLLVGVGLMLASFAEIDRLVWAAGLVK